MPKKMRPPYALAKQTQSLASSSQSGLAFVNTRSDFFSICSFSSICELFFLENMVFKNAKIAPFFGILLWVDGANYAVKNSQSLPCLGRKAGVVTVINAARRSDMTAATPAAGCRMLATAWRETESDSLHRVLWLVGFGAVFHTAEMGGWGVVVAHRVNIRHTRAVNALGT
jgi:hypothetical protein